MKKDVIHCSEFSIGGVYSLLLFLSKEVMLPIGKLGTHKFPCGYYIYTGSALGRGAAGLKYRITRHLKKGKRLFWHIDYLLANQSISVEAIIAVETNEKLECIVNSYLRSNFGAKVLVNGFGSSDCRNNCGSHLLYFPEIENTNCLVQKISRSLNSLKKVLFVHVIL